MPGLDVPVCRVPRVRGIRGVVQPSLAGLSRLADGTQHCVLGYFQAVPSGLDGKWKNPPSRTDLTTINKRFGLSENRAAHACAVNSKVRRIPWV